MRGYTQGIHYNGPDELVVEATGTITVLEGGAIEMEGVPLRLARGQHTTVAGTDTVDTGLAEVVSVIVSLDSDPVADCQAVTASIGNQSGAPAAGKIIIKTWKATAQGDTALIEATAFGKKVNWVALGA